MSRRNEPVRDKPPPMVKSISVRLFARQYRIAIASERSVAVVGNVDQTSLEWWQLRHAAVDLFRVQIEDEDEDDGETGDERDRRPEHAVYHSGDGDDVEDRKADVIHVIIAVELTVRKAMSLGELLHRLDVVCWHTITFVIGALCVEH